MNLAVQMQRSGRASRDWPAVALGGRVLGTYGELARRVACLAGALARTHGLRPGERVAIVSKNCPEYLEAVYACWHAGLVAVPVNAKLHADEFKYILDNSGARAAFVSPDLSASVGALEVAALEHVIEFGAPEHARALRSEPLELTDRRPEDFAWLFYTSGTTGRPKGAMLSHQTMLCQSAIVSAWRDFGPGDCPYVVAPMVHIFGLAGMFLPVMYGGAALELAARFDVGNVVSALKRGHLTHLYGAPPMFAALLAHSVETGRPVEAPRLREILAGGSPLDPDLRKGVEKAFGMALGHGYASTEFSPIATSRVEEPANEGATGRPPDGIEVILVDEAGKEVPRGEVGEVWCRGPCRMSGYFRDPEATAEIMRPGGWIAIGDLAYLDEDGQIHIVGRLKEMIIRSGFNVYPAEVESVLNSHPTVLQSAVVGRPVPGNEEVIAFVQAAPGQEIEADVLADHASEGLAPYKRPARIVVLDALPVGPTGKLSKITMREMADALD